MFVGMLGDTLTARVGPAECARVLARRQVRKMGLAGKAMNCYVHVDASAFKEESD
jgi:hypothetical protein